MPTCAICGKVGLSWTNRGGRQRIAKHFCIPTKEAPKPKMGGVKKDPLKILEGVTLSEKALAGGLLSELGLD